MCCRFYTEYDTRDDIIAAVAAYDRGIERLSAGDVNPSDPAAVITGERPGLYAREMRFGFPAGEHGTLLINARVETVRCKASFARSVEICRCVIPAKGFYEWDSDKNRTVFSSLKGETLYLAGIWKNFRDGGHFTVLTTKANGSMKPVHDRMPLILAKDEVRPWIEDGERTDAILALTPEELSVCRASGQISLFDA